MTMKRILSVLLIAVLLVASLGTVAFAAESDAKVVFSGNTVNTEPGKTATLTFSVNGNGLLFSNYSLSSVSTGTEMITISGSSITMNTSTGKAGYAGGENVGSHSFTISFNVAAETPAGRYPVTVSVNNVRNTNGETQPFAGTATGTIIVEKPACEHNWGAWTVTKAPTCTEKGVETRTCSLCDEKETREVAAKGHSFGVWTQTKAPTCTLKGEETRTCSVCDATETREVNTIGHKWEVVSETAGATCKEHGVITYKCANCGETKTEAGALGNHKFGGWVYNDTHHWHDCEFKCGTQDQYGEHKYVFVSQQKPTETEDGWYYYECECGKGYSEVWSKDMPNEPPMGDITGQVTMGAVAIMAMLAAAVAFVFKRKTAK